MNGSAPSSSSTAPTLVESSFQMLRRLSLQHHPPIPERGEESGASSMRNIQEEDSVGGSGGNGVFVDASAAQLQVTQSQLFKNSFHEREHFCVQ